MVLVNGTSSRRGSTGAEKWVTHWTGYCTEVDYIVSSTLATLGTNEPHK